MESSSGQERTEQATPKKRQEARRKGTVARSHELTSAAVVLALVLALPSVLRNLSGALMHSLQLGLGHIPTDLDSAERTRYFWAVLQGPLLAFLPLLGIALAVGLAGNFAQVGFVLSGEALAPNFAKLNPVNGVKRLLSATAGVEGLKACLKAALFAYLAWSTIQGHWNELVMLGWSNTGAIFTVIGAVLRQIFLKVVGCWIVLAGLDYYFQRRQVDKQLMMTKQEVKQEMREMEQAPELKAAISRKRRTLVRRMMAAVKTADVVVTNPTHFSVAIKYDSGKMHAPQVVAKGRDLVALKIREVAGENKVPIVPNPPLARQLYKTCEVGDFVPRELFQAVAEVLAYVYRTIRAQRAA